MAVKMLDPACDLSKVGLEDADARLDPEEPFRELLVAPSAAFDAARLAQRFNVPLPRLHVTVCHGFPADQWALCDRKDMVVSVAS